MIKIYSFLKELSKMACTKTVIWKEPCEFWEDVAQLPLILYDNERFVAGKIELSIL